MAAKEIYSMICWTIQKIPVRETSYFYYLNVMSIYMATRWKNLLVTVITTDSVPIFE